MATDESRSKCFSPFSNRTNDVNSTDLNSIGHNMDFYKPSDVKLIYPYGITAIYAASICFWFILMYIYSPTTDPHPSRVTIQSTSDNVSDDLQIDLAATSPRTPTLSFSGSIRGRNSFSSQRFGEKNTPGISRTASIASKSTNGVMDTLDIPRKARQYPQSPLAMESSSEQSKKEQIKQQLKWYQFENPYQGLVIALAIGYFHMQYGLELTFGSFLTAFSVNSNVNMSSRDGAQVTFIYWASFTFWRLFTIFYIRYTGPRLGIMMNLAILVIGNIIMIPFGFYNEWALYTGVVLIGIGQSPLWGSMFGLLEIYFPVTSRITASIMTSAALGEFIFPAILAKYMQCQAIVFIYITLVCSICTVSFFLSVITVCKYKMNPSLDPNRVSTH